MNTAKKLLTLFVTAMAVQMLMSCGGGTLSRVVNESRQSKIDIKNQRMAGANGGGNSDMKAQ